MEEKKSKGKLIFVIVTMIALLIVASTATYAWFSFNPATNIEPIASTVSDGDSGLLIANQRDGHYDKTTTLILSDQVGVLRPISTDNLEKFYTSVGQDEKGMSIFFKEQSEPYKELMHGTVYLKSTFGDNDIYLYRNGLEFGSNAQTRAALRLGLKITTPSGEQKFILKLDAMGVDGATEKLTIPVAHSVVGGVTDSKSAVFVTDPADQIGEYLADTENGLKAGEKSLGFLPENQIATVEYWLYLEGCDENCINAVESTEINLSLAFAGIKRK